MKQALITFAISFSFAGTIFSQINLVLDPSMEDTTWGKGAAPFDWKEVSGTPDRIYMGVPYSLQSAPQNIQGYEFPRTGNSYYGVVCLIIQPSVCFPCPNCREIIQGKLQTTPKAGKKYCVEFWVSMADSISYAVNNLGAYLSDTSFWPFDMPNIPFSMPFTRSPQIVNNGALNPLTNKIGWTKISGSFIAKGSEKYILIGNFNTDASSDTVFVPGPASTTNMCLGKAAYYYIDDVSVYCCDADNCVDIPVRDDIFIPTAFSPNDDGNNDVLYVRSGGVIKELDFSVYDRWGELVFHTNDITQGWDGTYNGNKLSNGIFVYYCKGIINGKEFFQKGDITLIR